MLHVLQSIFGPSGPGAFQVVFDVWHQLHCQEGAFFFDPFPFFLPPRPDIVYRSIAQLQLTGPI